jgi:hypothetical protein
MLRKPVVLRDNGPAIAECAEVLCRIKTETAQSAEGAGVLPIEPRAVCLGAILDHRNAARNGHSLQRLDIRESAVEMGDDRRARAGGHCALEITAVHLHRFRIDIDVEWLGAAGANGCGAIAACVCDRNDSITRTHADAAQSELKRIGAIRDSHCTLRAAVRGESRLERRNLIAEHKAPASNNSEHRRFQRGSLWCQLPCKVEYGNRCHVGESGTAVEGKGVVKSRSRKVINGGFSQRMCAPADCRLKRLCANYSRYFEGRLLCRCDSRSE